MSPQKVKEILAAQFVDAEIHVDGEGAKYAVAIVSDDFSGKRPVARQQLVYAALNEFIASGEIHAVTMQLQTTDEAL